ncbi:MAG: tetratricopeptide repeat protein [Chlorobi bacterium]|nr:tetratricopeptide repeat protein [Chlorobiota bacterium]
MAKKKTKQPDNLQELESALTWTEQFIEDHQNIISYVVGGIILVVVAYLGFHKFYLEPKETEAQSQMFVAEQYFEKDSFNLALNGDGNYLGFLDIIDGYGITKSSNLAKYYCGISYLHLGQYEDAIDYLSEFKTDDLLLKPITEGAIGDAYLELGDQDKALSQYKKAYNENENEFTSPIYMFKAAKLLENLDELEQALEIYKKIKTDFPESNEARNVEKYIARVQVNLEK